MTKSEIKLILKRDPFVPIRMHVSKGRVFDVTHSRVAHVLDDSVLIFVGLKEGSVQAKSYDRFGFDAVERIEPLPKRRTGGKRKSA